MKFIDRFLRTGLDSSGKRLSGASSSFQRYHLIITLRDFNKRTNLLLGKQIAGTSQIAGPLSLEELQTLNPSLWCRYIYTTFFGNFACIHILDGVFYHYWREGRLYDHYTSLGEECDDIRGKTRHFSITLTVILISYSNNRRIRLDNPNNNGAEHKNPQSSNLTSHHPWLLQHRVSFSVTFWAGS